MPEDDDELAATVVLDSPNPGHWPRRADVDLDAEELATVVDRGAGAGVLPERVTPDLQATAMATAGTVSGTGTSATRTTVLPRPLSQDGASTTSVPRYEPRSVLGKGGMGEVMLEQDRDIDRPVAVKRLHPELADVGALARFAEEVRTIGQLEHPGIMPVHDVGIDESGQHYVVMKYVRGETLQEVIKQLRKGSPAHLARFTHTYRARVCLSILEAVGHAHGRGIIHRDLKPANIMVGPEGEVTVMDWGLAKRVGKPDVAGLDASPVSATAGDEADRMVQTEAGALMGTPLYMSPEQAARRNDELDARSDVYSLATLFFEFLSLKHPRNDKRGRGMDAWVKTVAEEEINHVALYQQTLMTGTPCEYHYWLYVVLYKDPAKRPYADAIQMADALKRILDGHMPVYCHISLAKRGIAETTHWIDRHPFAYSMTFWSGVTLSLVGAVWAVVM